MKRFILMPLCAFLLVMFTVCLADALEYDFKVLGCESKGITFKSKYIERVRWYDDELKVFIAFEDYCSGIEFQGNITEKDEALIIELKEDTDGGPVSRCSCLRNGIFTIVGVTPKEYKLIFANDWLMINPGARIDRECEDAQEGACEKFWTIQN